LIENFSKILHIIDIQEIESTLNKINNSITSAFITDKVSPLRNQLEIQLQKTKHKIKTISSHRHRRGLVNIGGKLANWIFGTMDNDDRIQIEEHLKTIDANNHQSITTLNKQIKINDDIQKNIELIRKHITENEVLTLKTLNYTTDITEKSIKNIHFLSILSDLNLLNSEIDKIQQNIVFARYGIMSHSILTEEEINEYDIDISKYKKIKCSLLNFNEKLIFAILIPNFTKTLAIKYKIIPIPNSNFEEIFIDSSDTNIIQYNNEIFLDNEETEIKQLKKVDICIENLIKDNFTNCNKIINKKFQIVEISSELILVKNAKNSILKNNCNHVKYKLNKNYLISFSNCTIKIDDITFSNKNKIVQNHFILPNYLNLTNVKLKIDLKEIHLNQVKNIEKIKEIANKSESNNVMSFISVSFILLIIISMSIYISKNIISKIIIRKRNKELENTQESVSKLKEGGIISSLNHPIKIV
jgi:hypothetical protein